MESPSITGIGTGLSVALDARSIWAELSGPAEGLDIIEHSLESQVKQQLQGAGKNERSNRKTLPQALLPWIRKSPERLKIMAGLLLWASPNGAQWPTVWNQGDDVLAARMGTLESLGWRDYQLEAVRLAVTAPLGRGILELGTGAGKTWVAAGIAYVAGGDWVYVVYGRDLVRQARESFAKIGELIRGEDTQGHNWTLAAYGWGGVPTWALQKTAGMLVDECHGVSARTRAHVVAQYRGGWRLGLSATPTDRTDRKNPLVIGLLGPPLLTIGVKELTEMGHLSRGRVVMVEV